MRWSRLRERNSAVLRSQGRVVVANHHHQRVARAVRIGKPSLIVELFNRELVGPNEVGIVRVGWQEERVRAEKDSMGIVPGSRIDDATLVGLEPLAGVVAQPAHERRVGIVPAVLVPRAPRRIGVERSLGAAAVGTSGARSAGRARPSVRICLLSDRVDEHAAADERSAAPPTATQSRSVEWTPRWIRWAFARTLHSEPCKQSPPPSGASHGARRTPIAAPLLPASLPPVAERGGPTCKGRVQYK